MKVLQQQHQTKWVWNGNSDKYVEGIIGAGLFSLFIGYKDTQCHIKFLLLLMFRILL